MRLAREVPLWLRDRELERLAVVAELVAHLHHAGCSPSSRVSPVDQRVALVCEALRRQCAARKHHRARGIAAGRRRRQSERAQHAAGTRAEDPRDAQLLRQRGRMQRARATERHQCEPARIDAALDSHQPQGAQHLRLGHPDDAPRALQHAELQLLREDADGALGRIRSSASPPASVCAPGRRPSSRLASVTVGRMPAAPVACGSRHGARRGRTDPQGAAVVAPRDRPAARPHRVDVERRQRKRATGHRSLRRLRHARVLDHAHVTRRTAHVQAQHVRLARQLRREHRAAHPARRSRQQRQRRMRARARDVRQPARGLHDLRFGQALRARARRQTLEIAVEQRRQRGVERRRGRALELAERTHQLMRERV